MSEAAPELVVVALIPAKPGSEDIVRDGLATAVPPSREDAGCRSYDLYESTATPGTFVTVERWDSQDDLNAHMKTPHLATLFATIGDHLAGAPAIHTLRPIVTD